MIRAGIVLIGVALALATPMGDDVPGHDAGVIVALVLGMVLVLVAPRHRCRQPARRPAQRRRSRPDGRPAGHRPAPAGSPAVTNVSRLAGHPTDPGVGDVRPIRRHRAGE